MVASPEEVTPGRGIRHFCHLLMDFITLLLFIKASADALKAEHCYSIAAVFARVDRTGAFIFAVDQVARFLLEMNTCVIRTADHPSPVRFMGTGRLFK